MKQVSSRWRNLIAGFPCTSASNLNPAASNQANRTCVARADQAMGSVFHAIRKLVESHGAVEVQDLVRLLIF